MLAFPRDAALQQGAADLLANVGAIDLAAKRANGVPAAQPQHPDVETLVTRSLVVCGGRGASSSRAARDLARGRSRTCSRSGWSSIDRRGRRTP